jgi:hypothetical protein
MPRVVKRSLFALAKRGARWVAVMAAVAARMRHAVSHVSPAGEVKKHGIRRHQAY